MPSASDSPNSDEHITREQIIWQVVCSIPVGRVASYGQIAALSGLAGLARFVGRTMSQLPENSDVPWHRVLRSDGRLAFPPESERFGKQQLLLLEEGVDIRNGRVSLGRFGWKP
ncbi:MGMT family protein [Marinobacter sp. 1Y8]